jgi:pimeloyl-ACP methyl ester carboxylesterase
VIVALVATPVILYRLADPEKLDLDDSVRRATPGQFARLTDGYTHYEIGGPAAGPTVVLAAGFSVPYYIWDPTFKALTEAGFRVLRYDYYGRGFSDRPDTAYTQSFYIRQLADLLEAVRLTEPIDLVGLSLGAAVTTSFADTYPDRVRSLIFVDPAFRTPGAPPPFASMPFFWHVTTVFGAQRRWADDQMFDFLHPERFPDWPDRYRVQMRYRGFRRARLSELAANAAVDQQAEIERVGQHPRPVLVIWGKEDLSVPFESSGPLLQAMPRARLAPIEESGHLPQWEQPELTHAAMTEFLRELK